MIVFPLIRSVGLKSTTASSRAATSDVCPQPTIPDPLDELTQLGAIGYDDEVNRQAARGPRLCRAGNGHQRSSGANHARRPLRDVAAENIENQIDLPTSSRASLSRSTNSCAPKSSAV